MDQANYPITREDIRAMRQAHDVYAIVREGRAYLSCVARRAADSVFNSESDARREVPTNNVRSGGYGTVTDAFEHIGGGEFDQCWQTICTVLKPGDTLTLDWYPDAHSNGYLKVASIREEDSRAEHDRHEADRQRWAEERGEEYKQEGYFSMATPAGGLHADVLYLRARRLSEEDRRMGRNGKSFTFAVAHGICPDNSARMIRSIAS